MKLKMVKLQATRNPGEFKLTRDDGKFHVISFGDHCSAARYFGWKACEKCDSTDGSIDCRHHTVEEMESDALVHLYLNNGESTDDPGWFDA